MKKAAPPVAATTKINNGGPKRWDEESKRLLWKYISDGIIDPSVTDGEKLDFYNSNFFAQWCDLKDMNRKHQQRKRLKNALSSYRADVHAASFVNVQSDSCVVDAHPSLLRPTAASVPAPIDPGECINLISKEGKTFRVLTEIAKVSQLVATVLEEENHREDNHDVDITLPAVNTSTLERVIEFCTIYAHSPMNPISIPINYSTIQSIQDPYLNVVDLHHLLLIELLAAANFMGIEALLDLTSLELARYMCDKSSQEISNIFNRITSTRSKDDDASPILDCTASNIFGSAVLNKQAWRKKAARRKNYFTKQIDSGPAFDKVKARVWVPNGNGDIAGFWSDAIQCTPMGTYRETRKTRAEGCLVNGAICIVNGIYTLVKKEQFQCKQPCSAKQNPHSWKATDAPATLLTGMLLSSKDGRCYGRIKWDGANEQWIREDKITLFAEQSKPKRRHTRLNFRYQPGEARDEIFDRDKSRVDVIDKLFKKLRSVATHMVENTQATKAEGSTSFEAVAYSFDNNIQCGVPCFEEISGMIRVGAKMEEDKVKRKWKPRAKCHKRGCTKLARSARKNAYCMKHQNKITNKMHAEKSTNSRK